MPPRVLDPRTARYPSEGEIVEVLTVSCFADHDGDALIPVLPQQRQQSLVPEQVNKGPLCLVQHPPAFLVHPVNAPGRGQRSYQRPNNSARRRRRDLDSHCASSSAAMATTRVAAPAFPSRSRTKVRPSR